MAKIEHIPRNCMAWLLLSLVAVVIPHSLRLPVWEMIGLVAVLVWRIQLYRGAWIFPNRWIKAVLAVGFTVALFYQYGTFYGLDPMVALLMVSVMLKLLEMHKKRDVITVIFLGYFTTSIQFLFSQTVFDFLYGLFCLILLLAAQISLYQDKRLNSMAQAFPMAGKIVLQSIPVMLILFLLFPRIGSLWAVPLPKDNATTGVSNSMSPGDFSKLSKSGGRAFTATFDGDVPANRDLYWRGLVFSHFDGRAWVPSRWGTYPGAELVDWVEQGAQEHQPWYSWAEPKSETIKYEVILEPTNQPWLFSLPLANISQEETGLTRTFTWIKKGAVNQRYRYTVESNLQYDLAVELPAWLRQLELQLPEDFNPRTRELAQQWRREATDDWQIVNRFLNHITRDFTYTLEPPALGRNTVDEFLFQTKRGFCEHFASSFVFFMRAAGIPSRVVTGYQGGERIQDFIQVSQSDAHAWAEVWIAGEGWKRVDPTSSVAPSRIESGMDAVFQRAVNNPLSIEAYKHIGILNELRRQLDVWNYNWQKWVLNYNQDKQEGLISKLFGSNKSWAAGLSLVIGLAGFVALLTLVYWWRGRPRPLAPGLREYHRFARKFKKFGVERKPGEDNRAFTRRVCEQFPEKKDEILQISNLFEAAVYAGNAHAIKDLKTKISKFSVAK